jgi:hypothetical protein
MWSYFANNIVLALVPCCLDKTPVPVYNVQICKFKVLFVDPASGATKYIADSCGLLKLEQISLYRYQYGHGAGGKKEALLFLFTRF